MTGAARIAAALLLSTTAALHAGPPFVLPVDCTLGEGCFIQQYLDRDPGPGVLDHACGPLSHDGHDGTDIAVPTLADMGAGVAVLAPAAGTVRAIRDGMPDIASNDPAAPPLEGRDCGNGVLIDHADGWQTQLCHLAQGSVAVAAGDAVMPGQPLGRIGLSGRTEFPHLHLTIRRNGTAVDPFAPDPAAACTPEPVETLWADPPAYRPGGILGLGLAADPPTFEAVKAGLAETPGLDRRAPALLLWVHLFGTRAGDRLTLRLAGPQGAIVDDTVTLDRTQARAYRFAGRRTPAAGWPAGPYTREVTLTRNGRPLETRRIALTLGP
jgi:hypothetical protein